MSELACSKCQKPQSQLTEALKRCARCQQAKYCSTTCQRADWPRHKRQCDKPRPTSDELLAIRMRATVRLSLESSHVPEDETIFYLEKSTPHLDDISLAGPFYPRKAILEQVKSYFQKGESLAGLLLACDFDDEEEDLRKVLHFKGPLDDDPSKFILVKVISQHDPDMARRLPGPVFNVVRSVPMLPQETAERGSQLVPSPYPRVKEMEVYGCYTSADEAIAQAEKLIQSCQQELQRPQRGRDERTARRPSHQQDGEAVFEDFVIGQDEDGRPKSFIVTARYDSGIIRHPPSTSP